MEREETRLLRFPAVINRVTIVVHVETQQYRITKGGMRVFIFRFGGHLSICPKNELLSVDSTSITPNPVLNYCLSLS